jgi:all-trans-retinol dehydrogenase (NAD+)
MFQILASAAAFLVAVAFAPDQQYARYFSILTWVLAAGFLWAVNARLNQWAENRWIWKDDKSAWRWRFELAVVTGGSKGIGAQVVKKLVSYGIKVAILDIEPWSDEFEACMLSKRSMHTA